MYYLCQALSWAETFEDMGIDLLSAEVHLSEVTLCNKSVSTCLMPLFKNNIVGVESEVSNNSAQHEVSIFRHTQSILKLNIFMLSWCHLFLPSK